MVALIAICFRLTVGVDLSDESFYAATAQSMLDWGGPAKMCWNLAQPSMFLVLPFIKFWRDVLHMHNTGVILALRFFYLCMVLLSSFLLTSYARTRVSSSLAAVLIGMLPLVWIPYSLPAPSYNTIGENFFLIGLLLSSLAPGLSINSWSRAVLSAAPFVVACIAYPSFTLASLVFLLAEALLEPDLAKKQIARKTLLVVSLAGTIAALSCVAICGRENIANIINFLQACSRAGTENKLTNLRTQLFSQSFPAFAGATIACSLLNACLGKRSLLANASLWLLAALLVWIEFSPTAMYLQSHCVLLVLAMFLALVSPFLVDVPASTKVAFGSALLAGFSTTFGSGNGAQAFCIGAFPAVCLGLSEVVRELMTQPRSLFASCTAWILLGTCNLSLAHSTIARIYGVDRQLSVDSLQRMPSGPFRWIRTNQKQRELVLSLQKDLSALPKNVQTIYVIGPPGVYLCTDLKSMDPYMYHAKVSVEDALAPLLIDFYAKNGQPDVLVTVDDPWFGEKSQLEKELIKSSYVLYLSRPAYKIYLNKEMGSFAR